LELGIAELISGDPRAAERLGYAIEELDDPSAKAAAAQARAVSLFWQNRLADAMATIDRVHTEVAAHDNQLTLTLDALRLSFTMAYLNPSAERRHVGTQLRQALRLAKPGLLRLPWVGECPIHRGSGGQSPASESMARAIRAPAEWKP
jgi:hypothetical protein